jgi:hypothetical protein
MDASRPIAWAIGLVVVAFGIAVIGGPGALVEHLTRLVVELPTVASNLPTLVSETKAGWLGHIFSFAVLLILLWSKLR